MKLIAFTLLFAFAVKLDAQIPLTTVPDGGNKKASISEWIGLTEVRIDYSRPGVKGREGKIWGELVHYGLGDLGFGNTKMAPWRAGANENTTISFSNDVKINGQNLLAGKYGFFVIYDSSYCTLIFSKNNSSWGAFYYDPAEDALRIQVKPSKLNQSVEWLQYTFINQTSNTATIALEWEKLQIAFTVEADYIRDQLNSFRKELRSERGFIWQAWNQAAQWCVQNNVNLDQALVWADTATSATFGGQNSFQAWTTKSQILQKLNRSDEAFATMQKILPNAGIFEVHQYARQLIGLKLFKQALDVFKMNYEKHPNTFTTLVGMTRGLSANGEFDKALSYAKQALELAPDPANKINVEGMIKKLKERKDVN
ncbi:MAG: DUF2911 domain-containing protein [Saprospiraceae bacterium]|nr:DUF2911 domain-containing protein [Saprospiraceae bacterium]HRG69033.1 DUF2911 domain-containing protein [Saprospiraceae bacterium]